MITIISGGRHYKITPQNYVVLNEIHNETPITEVRGDHSRGGPLADRCGMVWAATKDIPTRSFTAEWERFGRGAAPIRNREMLMAQPKAQMLIAFPGIDGAAEIISQAEWENLRIWFIENGQRKLLNDGHKITSLVTTVPHARMHDLNDFIDSEPQKPTEYAREMVRDYKDWVRERRVNRRRFCD